MTNIIVSIISFPLDITKL